MHRELENDINEYLDEMAVTIEESCDSENDMHLIETRIENVRYILHKLINNPANILNKGIMLKTSRTLDMLLNIYYKKKK